jgi:hypothetical protein
LHFDDIDSEDDDDEAPVPFKAVIFGEGKQARTITDIK